MGLKSCYFVYEVSILKSWAIFKLGGGVGCCLLRLYRVCAELNGTGFNSNN